MLCGCAPTQLVCLPKTPERTSSRFRACVRSFRPVIVDQNVCVKLLNFYAGAPLNEHQWRSAEGIVGRRPLKRESILGRPAFCFPFRRPWTCIRQPSSHGNQIKGLHLLASGSYQIENLRRFAMFYFLLNASYLITPL